jgi:prepilin-type N-terminal cleavage/methylation domain-containing protein/prepilin-type processing-associated H-X9-DG protein
MYINPKRSVKAFTLIELLVVIAVIALLLAILMPVLQKAKEIAKNLSCRANIRSLSIGFRLYAETNGNKVFGHGSSSGNNLWLKHIADQIGNIDKVRFCSSTKRNTPDGSNWGSAKESWVWNSGGTEPEYGSFAINGFAYSGTPSLIVPTDEWESSKWGNANAANSANIPIFIDAMWVDLWPQHDDHVPVAHDLQKGGFGGDGPNRNQMVRSMIDRHGGALSVSFMDGHVEPIALRQIWSLKWSKQFIANGSDKLRSDGTKIYKK